MIKVLCFALRVACSTSSCFLHQHVGIRIAAAAAAVEGAASAPSLTVICLRLLNSRDNACCESRL